MIWVEYGLNMFKRSTPQTIEVEVVYCSWAKANG